jgi:choline-sulfatase
LRDEKLAPFPRTEYAVRVNRQEYYALITHMDAQVGKILDALEASGEPTYLFFTADHGLACGNHGLLGKQNMYEHSMRPPLVVAGPGIPQHSRRDGPVYMQDIMPTTLELAGVDLPEGIEFKSLLPMIRGERDQNYDRIYGAYTHRQRMLVEGDYKLILYPTIAKLRLYHLESDPRELTDLAADPQQRPRIKQLLRSFFQLQQAQGDPLKLQTVYADWL